MLVFFWWIFDSCRTILWKWYKHWGNWISSSPWRRTWIDWQMQITQTINCHFWQLTHISPLLNKVCDDSIYGLWTIRENWLQGASQMNKKRRAYDQTSDGKNIMIAWRDNNAVIFAINYLSCEPTVSVKC